MGGVGSIKMGSDEHEALFCREFVETHDPFVPSKIQRPALDEETPGRLKALPNLLSLYDPRLLRPAMSSMP